MDVQTHLGRVLVQETVLLPEHANHILDYERASCLIDEADYVGVGTCYCRHKNLHLGIECKIHAPLETCMTLGNVARSLAEHGGYTRLISKSEAKEILSMCYESNLVQMGENVRNNPSFICNCCGCCCEALGAAKRFAPSQPIATSNYIPKLMAEGGIGCVFRQPGAFAVRPCGEKIPGGGAAGHALFREAADAYASGEPWTAVLNIGHINAYTGAI